MYGYAGFLLGFCLASIFICLIDLLLPGTFRNGVFYGEYPDLTQDLSIPNYILIIGLCDDLSLQLSRILLCIAFEITIKRTKYLFSILTFTSIIFLIIIYINLVLFRIYLEILSFLMLIYLFFFSSILLPYILYYTTKWTRSSLKQYHCFYFWVIY